MYKANRQDKAPGKLETPPTIPRQKVRERDERELGQRKERNTRDAKAQWGEEAVKITPALHYTGLLDNPFSNSELRTSLRA